MSPDNRKPSSFPPRAAASDGRGRPLSRSGFTLLEVMVAVTIAGIVFAGLFAVFDKVLNVADQVSRQANLVQVGQRIVGQISNDLDSFYYPTQTGDTANATSHFRFSGRSPGADGIQGNVTVLELATASSLSFEGDFPARCVNRVSYVLEPSGSEAPGTRERYRLVRTQTPCADVPGNARKSRSITMSTRVGSMKLAFLGGQDRMPRASWNGGSFGVEERKPPRAVRIELTIVNDRGNRERFRVTRVLAR